MLSYNAVFFLSTCFYIYQFATDQKKDQQYVQPKKSTKVSPQQNKQFLSTKWVLQINGQQIFLKRVFLDTLFNGIEQSSRGLPIYKLHLLTSDRNKNREELMEN